MSRIFFLRKPSPREIERRLRKLDQAPPVDRALIWKSHADHDFNRIWIGQGEEDFARSIQALREWKMFPPHWTEIYPPIPPLREGTTVAVLARVFFFWTLNFCRIVHVIDGGDRFGFLYRTMKQHVEIGEERFVVEQRINGDVFYEVRAISRPRHLLARICHGIARRFQRRFAAESKQAMLVAMSESTSKGVQTEKKKETIFGSAQPMLAPWPPKSE